MVDSMYIGMYMNIIRCVIPQTTQYCTHVSRLLCFHKSGREGEDMIASDRGTLLTVEVKVAAIPFTA